MADPKDMKAAGSVRLSGGVYRDVNVSGSANISGDVDCQTFRVSGSARMDGSLKTGECHISGSAGMAGSLTAASAQVSGSGRVDGDVTVAGELRASGSLHVGGGIKAQSAQTSGSLYVDQGIECEALNVSGAIEAGGLVNANTVDISLGGRSRLTEVGGERVTVKRRMSFSLNLFGLSLSLGAQFGGLTADTIEASTVELECTRAQVVRGADVTIGAGCEIDRVEYSNTLVVEDDAVVRERIKVG